MHRTDDLKPEDEPGGVSSSASTQGADGCPGSLFSPARRGWLLAGILILAAALRILCALNDLWLDEIWSLTSVRKISSPLKVFTGIHLDNNHYLNSLWLFAFRDHGNWAGYRVPAIAAGFGCVALAGIIAGRKNPRAAFFAMVLAAFSYVQILYSSEARGYSEALFFSFLSFYALEEWLENGGGGWLLLFSISSIMGFASDLIFLNFFCAALVWSGWRVIRSNQSTGRKITSMLACHAGPAAFLVMLYFVDIRMMVIGGGMATPLPVAYVRSLAWTLGAPPGAFATVVTSLASAAFFCLGVWLLWRRRSDSWVFFAGVIVVFPVLLILIHGSDVIYVRYFFIGMGFILVLGGWVLSELWTHGRLARMGCLFFMAVYLTVNGWHTASLLKFGRGGYSEAVRFLIQTTRSPVITIGSDHDFRVSVVLRFYVDQAMEDNTMLLNGDKTIQYYPRGSWPAKGPEWVILHRESFGPVPSALERIPGGKNYELIKIFPSAPLSGLEWFIYHNKAAQFSIQ